MDSNLSSDDAALCDLAGAHAALRHLVAYALAEKFMRKPKRAFKDAEAFFASPASRPAIDMEKVDTDALAALVAAQEREHARMRDAVAAMIVERQGGGV